MKAILILEDGNEYFYPLLEKDRSISFLPFSLNSTLLSIFYSWINSYFSKDKIFVCCKNGEQDLVLSYCSEMPEENIIIEPERYSYSLSVLFASTFVEKLYPDSVSLFIPVSFGTPHNLKMKNWLLQTYEICQSNWVVIPTFLLNRGEFFIPYLDAGKIVTNLKGVDFFEVEKIFLKEKNLKKSKLFGKQAGITRLVCGKFKSIINCFMDSIEPIYKTFNNILNLTDVKWLNIENLYKDIKKENLNIEIFNNNRNLLTIFLDKKLECLDNWDLFFTDNSNNHEDNVFHGKVISNNCKKVICFNYDQEEIEIDSLKNLLIVKRNGKVAIKNIL